MACCLMAICWTNVNLSSKMFCCIHLAGIPQEKLPNLNCNMYSKITLLKSKPHFLGANELKTGDQWNCSLPVSSRQWRLRSSSFSLWRGPGSVHAEAPETDRGTWAESSRADWKSSKKKGIHFQLDESTARRHLKAPRSLSGRSLHLTLVTKWSRSHMNLKIQILMSWPSSNPLSHFRPRVQIDMFAFCFVAIGPFLAEI